MTIGNRAIVHGKKWQNQGDIDKNTNDVHCKKQGSEKATSRGEFECGLEIQVGFVGPISNARSKKEKKFKIILERENEKICGWNTLYASINSIHFRADRDKTGEVTWNHCENSCMPWGRYTRPVKEESSKGADQNHVL